MRVSKLVGRWVMWSGVGVLATVAWAAAPDPTPVSKYVAAPSLLQQIEYYQEELQKDLAAEADYDEDHQNRVAKAANTLIVLAQALGNHDGEGAEIQAGRKSSAALLAAAEKLAASSAKYSEAKAALDALVAARQQTGEPVQGWEATADLAQLMKQVPVVNNGLRGGVTSRRFERTAEKTAGLATTLAAIGQASSVDFDYCSGPEDEAEWQKICLEMRDASAEVAEAIRKLDQKGAEKGLERIVQTCDACHHRFRD